MFNRDNNSGGFAPRQMLKGNWKCSNGENCVSGGTITELPFEPAPDRPIYCRECWKKMRDERGPRRY